MKTRLTFSIRITICFLWWVAFGSGLPAVGGEGSARAAGAAIASKPAEGAGTATVTLDFTQGNGAIKPLHGINNSPVTYGEPLPELKAAGIPYCRLHDAGGPFGGTYFVDIPNLFPNFDANPDEPASYEFAFTDAYLKGLRASGVKIFYRLGVTIENHYKVKAYRIHPPKDAHKFAKVCEQVVRHYNEGWANGFHYGIEYWEIWNEPENPPMWTGTKQQYFELYRVTANHLKQQFPQLKVGGYAGCGFYAVNRPKQSAFHQGFLTFFDDFLKYVTTPETAAPLDFYSWHLYTADPREIVVHAEYADSKLKQYGLATTERIFDEWNFMNGQPSVFEDMKEMPGAAFAASAFCLMQAAPIDKAMYYDALPQRTYGGLYYFPSQKVSKTYYSFKAFNELYKLGTYVHCRAEGSKDLYACAAKGQDGQAAALVVNNGATPLRVRLDIHGRSSAPAAVLLDKEHLLATADGLLEGSTLSLPPLSVALLKF